MCLILFAYRAHPRYPLVVAANRDEWFRRPSAPASFWTDQPNVLAGRDLEQGGTWLGITRTGRFAALTNFRDPGSKRESAPSRGALVSGFLEGENGALPYAARLVAEPASYNGFNLLAADADTLTYVASRTGEARSLSPGVYGLSNGLLDEPWPKVVKGREALCALLDQPFGPEDLLAVLKDHAQAPDAALPSTGVSLEWERLLSAMHIVADGYGTRCATALVVDVEHRVTFVERTFDPTGRAVGEVAHHFRFEPTGSS